MLGHRIVPASTRTLPLAIALATVLVASRPVAAQEWGFPVPPHHQAYPERPWGNPPRASQGRSEPRRTVPAPEDAQRPATARGTYDPWTPQAERPWADHRGQGAPATPYRRPQEGRDRGTRTSGRPGQPETTAPPWGWAPPPPLAPPAPHPWAYPFPGELPPPPWE